MITLGGQAPPARPMGVHRTCGEPNETELAVRVLTRYFTQRPLLQAWRTPSAGPSTCAVATSSSRWWPRPGTRPEPFNSTPMGANSIPSGPPHVRCTPMGVHRACGAWPPDEIKKNTHPKIIPALLGGQAEQPGVLQLGDQVQERVRVVGRSISPPWRSIRFRLAPCTYAPWGCIVRVVGQTKSRKIPMGPKNITALFCEQDPAADARHQRT